MIEALRLIILEIVVKSFRIPKLGFKMAKVAKMTGNEHVMSSLSYAQDKKATINEKTERPEVSSVVSLSEILSQSGEPLCNNGKYAIYFYTFSAYFHHQGW